jgi:hypothetical protein
MFKNIVLIAVLSLFVLAACGTAAPAKPVFAYPSPIPCNASIGNQDIVSKMKTIASAHEVRVLVSVKDNTIFWADGTQICTSVGASDVIVDRYYVTQDGLTNMDSLSGYQDEAIADWQDYGTADVEFAADSFDHANHVDISTVKPVGPNDAAVLAAWPSQKDKIGAAVSGIFKASPVAFANDTTLWANPQDYCDEMEAWEDFVPLPQSIYSACHKGYTWLDGDPHQYLIAPDASYGDIYTAYLAILKNTDANIYDGSLKVGQKFGDYTVEETCVSLTPDQVYPMLPPEFGPWTYNYVNPVGIKLNGLDHYIAVSKNSFVGYGPFAYNEPQGDQGWHVYSVCP